MHTSFQTRINERAYPVECVQMDLPQIDLIAWLESETLYPKVFWKERDQQVTRAAVGSLLMFNQVPNLDAHLDLRLYGGIRFDSTGQTDPIWQGFPQTCFWLPEIEITQSAGNTQGVFYALGEPAKIKELSNLLKHKPRNISSFQRSETPDFAQWKVGIESALQAIDQGIITKLVPARKSSLEFSQCISHWSILNYLNNCAKRATVFAFQLAPHLCFLGATPEKLFQRKGNSLNADAIASTRPRGRTPDEDASFEDELLNNSKEIREFQIVKDFLEIALCPFSEHMAWESTDKVIKASHVQHLYNRINAQLKSDVSTAALIRALHPTPALGGYPQKRALKILRESEPFDRGWYGAPIGMIGQNETSLYVGIRSALIRENWLHIFAGTGVVRGSDAQKEWDELEQKIRPILEAVSWIQDN